MGQRDNDRSIGVYHSFSEAEQCEHLLHFRLFGANGKLLRKVGTCRRLISEQAN
jgi:hypothetical protein